jgi:hypothetical protein
MDDITRQKQEVKVEKGLEELSRYLDGLFRVPGTDWRFGLDALVGLVPNIGDTLTVLPSFYILLAGVRYGVPKITLLRMAFNIGIDYFVGSIPVIGDAFDFVWKANQKNMDLIRARGAGLGEGTTSDYVFLAVLFAVLLGLLIGSILVSAYVIYWLLANLSRL